MSYGPGPVFPQHPPEPPPAAADDEFVPGRLARPRTPKPPGTANRGSIRRGGLVAAIVVVALLHVVAVAWLWPRGPAPVAAGINSPYAGVIFTQGAVQKVIKKSCAGTTDTRLPDGTIPKLTTCTSAVVVVSDGPEAGKAVTVGVTPEVANSGVRAGVAVQLARYPAVEGAAVSYAVLDFARGVPLGLLAVVFAVLVIAVARLRGVMALAALGLAFVAIAVFVLPALHRGENPVLVAAVGAGAIMIAVLYLTHGFSTMTTTALLGTLAGIWVTAGLAAWVTAAAHLNGLGSEENLALSRLTTGRGLDGLILAGIVLAGLGVLNDVTITQASAVWELRRRAPQLAARGLFTSGMRIGRDHLASTIYTIAFAYAGVVLPTLLLSSIYGEPIGEMINSNQIGEEIARSLVASIGLILSIPFTTAIAAVLAARAHPDTAAQVAGPSGRGHIHSHG